MWYLYIYAEILIWNQISHLVGGLLKTWHVIQVYLYITCVGSSSQLDAFHSIKSSFFSLFFSYFSSSFSRLQCVHSAMHAGRKHYCKWPSDRVFISPKNRNTQWVSHLSCQNIWLANISKHWLQMSICTVTQTVKWLHVAAGQQPTLRKRVKEIFQVFIFRFSITLLQNWVALWW